LDGLIFDFDGVVVDSEPIHFVCFREVLQSRRCELTREDYYAKYLGFDDHDGFLAVLGDNGISASETEVAKMIEEKTAMVKAAFAESLRPLPGAVDLIKSASAAGLALAVCSGALGEEVRIASRRIGVFEDFPVIVAAEDVSRGKPDPEGYHLTLKKLSAAAGRDIAAARSLAVEDSPTGADAAKAAGLKVLAVTNSYNSAELKAADRIVHSLAGVTVASLEELF
jgi:HAD superfamily hydrolase (TIGR01509 family)